MHDTIHTRWQGTDLVVLRDDHEVDRIAADRIRRVILVCRHGGQNPGDLVFAVVETDTDHVILPAASGIAGRVHFERQQFWAQRPCVYWVDEAHARLPAQLRPGLAWLTGAAPRYARLPHHELAALVEAWPLDGPQSWEQRKWERIVRMRRITPASPGRDAVATRRA